MIPINPRCLKEQEDSRTRILKDSEVRIPQLALPDYCPQLHNPIDTYLESYLKCQIDGHESHNFLAVHPEEYAERCQNMENQYILQNYFDPNNCFHLKNNWFIGNNNNCYEDLYNYKIKRQEYDEQKFWPAPIKDEESPSANHQHGFQTYQVPKQEEFQYAPRCIFEDPNKFLGTYLTPSREEKRHQRKLKVQAYLKKKTMRSFEKKIIYKCRKQVADNRIRYRGRFISLTQAAEILGLDPKINHNSAELMEKLKALGHVEPVKQKEEQVKQEYIKENQNE